MNKELILINEQYFSSLIEDIEKAVISIHIEAYIFDQDEIGRKIFASLISAVKRGVEVFLLIDGFGSSHWDPMDTKEFEKAGGVLKIYHPLPWMFKHWRWGTHLPKFIWEKLIYLITHINSRNHRKLCIIDYKIAYIGSANITAYPKNLDKNIKWHDMTVRYEGNVNELEYIFALSCGNRTLRLKAYRELMLTNEHSPFQLNYTWKIRRIIYKRLLFQLKNAKKRIWIINPYFVPSRAILVRLKKAAQSNIDVRILIPALSDVPGVASLQKNFYSYLLKSSVTVLEYPDQYILHAKILIIDDWFCVGSSNLNYRSFHRDLEADLIIQSNLAKNAVENYINNYFSMSKKITFDDLKKQSHFEKIIGKILFLIRYWF